MTPIEYLDACKQKIGIRSDYELARRLEWNKQGISNVRKGQRSLPSEIAFRMADMLGLAHSVVWADIEAHQEKDPKKRAYWEEFLARAAVFVMAIGVGSAALPGESQAAPLSSAPKEQSVLCKIFGWVVKA
jgi:plasmid maintenance system antidote protein VapI